MPISDLHKRQKRKNLAVLAVLLGLIALVFAITMMRLGGR